MSNLYKYVVIVIEIHYMVLIIQVYSPLSYHNNRFEYMNGVNYKNKPAISVDLFIYEVGIF